MAFWAYKGIKGRNYGNNEVLDVIISVDSSLNIRAAHDIACQVEHVLINEHDVYDVHVHVEPE